MVLTKCGPGVDKRGPVGARRGQYVGDAWASVTTAWVKWENDDGTKVSIQHHFPGFKNLDERLSSPLSNEFLSPV